MMTPLRHSAESSAPRPAGDGGDGACLRDPGACRDHRGDCRTGRCADRRGSRRKNQGGDGIEVALQHDDQCVGGRVIENYNSFKLNDPFRIVVDVWGVGQGTAASEIPVGTPRSRR